ncbi:MAG: methyltransferase domain-containing protein [Chloroflexota bacterium]|nr:methyltransferase domain-containing protein [Chloroflexota bacterium]
MTEIDDPASVKSCCAALYASDWAKLLLGESFHPGGLRTTDRLARLLDIDATHTILDVACGQGTSALYLARTFGCRVVGIDLSEENIAIAARAAWDAGLADLVSFRVGDGEAIPVEDASVDALICECAFCTFPSKERAAAEFARVLRLGGVVGLSDLTLAGDLPAALDGLLAWIACVADARPVDEYVAYLADAGFVDSIVEEHDEALSEMVASTRQKLLGAEILVKLAGQPQSGFDLGEAVSLARAVEKAVRAGRLGYALIVARQPGVLPLQPASMD